MERRCKIGYCKEVCCLPGDRLDFGIFPVWLAQPLTFYYLLTTIQLPRPARGWCGAPRHQIQELMIKKCEAVMEFRIAGIYIARLSGCLRKDG